MLFNYVLIASYISITFLALFLFFPSLKKALEYDYTFITFDLLLWIGSIWLSVFILGY